MKSGKILFTLTALILFLTGCQNKISKEDFDFTILDQNNIYTVKEQDGKLKQVEKLKRNDGDQNFDNYYIASDNNSLYSLTVPMEAYRDTYIVKIDKNTLVAEKEKFNLGNTLSVDDNYIYISSISGDKEDIFKYDKNTLKKISQKTISDENVNLIRDIVRVDNELYALVGTVNRTDFSKATFLWKLDNDLNIKEKINLNFTTGGYLRMVLVGEDLYMIEGTNGVTSAGEPGPGKNLVRYNIKTQQVNKVPLKTPYPYNLYYDKNNNNLIIQHYGLYENDFPFTIYSLDNKKEKIITFPEYNNKGSNISSFSCGKDSYYFLLGSINEVAKYDLKTGEIKKYDLSEFSMKKPHEVIAK